MKFTIKQFRKRYPNDDVCLDSIMQLRYGEIASCPSCKKETRFHRVKSRRCYECQWCGYQVYPTKGTPFEKSVTPLTDWFFVIYKMTSTRSGVSAKQVERELGVTYKTAWRMCHQVRILMGTKTGKKLSGHIEVDETYIGGVRKGRRGRGADGKTVVFGMVERGGRVKAVPVPNAQKKTITPYIIENVEKGARISSDELRSYNALNDKGYMHDSVRHAAKQYVNGDTHTQSIEGFWSRLKLSIRGTHVWVSRKHLGKYVDEFSFRYSNRKEAALMFDRLLANLAQPFSIQG